MLSSKKRSGHAFFGYFCRLFEMLEQLKQGNRMPGQSPHAVHQLIKRVIFFLLYAGETQKSKSMQLRLAV